MTSRPKPRPGSHDHRFFDVNPTRYSEPKPLPKTPRDRPNLPFDRSPSQFTPGIAHRGESFRRGIHPWKCLAISFRSSSRIAAAVNILWPVVPPAIIVHFVLPDSRLLIFILNYIAMLPAANMLGFAAQELARKLSKVWGVLLETTFGSVVEIILFVVLISRGEFAIPIIKAAILGSILANLLLCLGMCFFVGGLTRDAQEFHEAVSEVGTSLMLVAGMGLVIPAAFSAALTGNTGANSAEGGGGFEREILNISRATAIMLLVAKCAYVYFQIRTHHGLYDQVFEHDERRDQDREKDARKAKLTFTECILVLAISLTCVSLIAVFLVEQIDYVVELGVSEAFVGLILLPLVEKLAEHLTAVDEAWDNQMNLALSHVLGACIQTALLNTPIVVIVGWGLGRHMDLNFEIFDAVVLILAILVVGSFLRDGSSNYLEGFLSVVVYIMIAVSAYYYPNPSHGEAEGGQSEGG